MKITFQRREELAPTIWQYYFSPERLVRFVPGQYADFHLPHLENDPRGRMRTFTLTSLPTDKFVSFVVKIVEPASPYKQALELLQIDDELRMDDPMGDLILPKSPAVPLVFIAGGIGLASYAGSLKLLLKQNEERDIYLFYALRSRYEQIFQELTDAYPLQLRQVILAPNRLGAADIKKSVPSDALLYLSGSQKFVEDLQTTLGIVGVPHEQLIFDYFDGYAEL